MNRYLVVKNANGRILGWMSKTGETSGLGGWLKSLDEFNGKRLSWKKNWDEFVVTLNGWSNGYVVAETTDTRPEPDSSDTLLPDATKEPS